MHEQGPLSADRYYHHLADVDFARTHMTPDGTCPDWVIGELRKQRSTSTAEGSVPHAVVPVDQEWDASREAYIGYGDSTIRHAFTGINDLDINDPRNREELERRGAEYLEEIRLTRDEPLRDTLSDGHYKIALSCPPKKDHPHAQYMSATFNYDER